MKGRKIYALLAVPALALALGACGSGSGKPSKEEFRKALLSQYDEDQQLSDSDKEKVGALLDCMVDDSYEKLSEQGIKDAIDGRDITNKDDQKALQEVVATCLKGVK